LKAEKIYWGTVFLLPPDYILKTKKIDLKRAIKPLLKLVCGVITLIFSIPHPPLDLIPKEMTHEKNHKEEREEPYPKSNIILVKSLLIFIIAWQGSRIC